MLILRPFLFLSSLTVAQLVAPQTDTWNSTFALSSSQITAANISNATAEAVNLAVNFERTNWATGSVNDDSFYTDIPENSTSAKPGTLLKLQAFVNVSTYTIPPVTALSRFVYMTETSNGTIVPASAYILWPAFPLKHGKEGHVPVVAWAHGASGPYPECAPSHIRNLWSSFTGTFTAALSGYAVVAADYAGTGVSKTGDGRQITAETLHTRAGANDVIYAVQAAQQAFKNLSKQFVVVGHSQGGGAAWAVAEREALRPTEGYLGTIAGSPFTDNTVLLKSPGAIPFNAALAIAKGVVSASPSNVTLSDILTDQGIKLANLQEEVSGCGSVIAALAGGLVAEDGPSKLAVIQDGFLDSDIYKHWSELQILGGHEIRGPLLVLHGLNDTTVLPEGTNIAFNKTCKAFPQSELEYIAFEGVGHSPVMYAGFQRWRHWVEDRFAGKNSTAQTHGGCVRERVTQDDAPRPLEAYKGSATYFLEYSTQRYQNG